MSGPAANVFEVAYLHGGVAVYAAGDTFGPRQMSDYELVWITQGEAAYHADGETQSMPAGSVCLCRPGQRDGFTWDRSGITQHAFLHFDILSSPKRWPAMDAWPVVIQPESDGVVHTLFRELAKTQAHHRARGETPTGEFQRASRMLEVLLDAYLDAAAPQEKGVTPLRHPYPEAVHETMRLLAGTLRREPQQMLALDDLAASVNLTPKHLCRLYSGSVGMGPMRVARLMRLEAAMRLLTRSNLTVAQVAERFGYANPYHFSRAFREAFGVPPTEARRRVLEGDPAPRSLLPVAVPLDVDW